ncbi:MAG: DUF4956 domain-containing protein [Candidatus Krumholzibacteria bacterium]
MILRKLLRLCIEPPVRPVRRLTVYYLLLGAVTAALVWGWPPIVGYFQGGSDALGTGATFERVGIDDVASTGGYIVISLVISMVGALLLMLPVSWGYMGARRLTGFDQSVVQTMVILPIAIAGIVVMVKSSVALAFSLAGIVAGVRFRSSLQDTADALYIFAAIGVGLAAGIGELAIAVVISVFFNYVILGLWSCGYGTCPISGPKAGWSSKGAPAPPKKKKQKDCFPSA